MRPKLKEIFKHEIRIRQSKLEERMSDEEIGRLWYLFSKKGILNEEYKDLFEKAKLNDDPCLVIEHYRRKIPGAALLIDSYDSLSREIEGTKSESLKYCETFYGLNKALVKGELLKNKGPLFGDSDCIIRLYDQLVFSSKEQQDFYIAPLN